MSVPRFLTPRNYSFGLIFYFRVAWVIAILWCELGTFYRHIAQCAWPDALSLDLTPNSVYTPAHVLLVADPQVLDHRSYPDRPPWLMYISQFMVDFNLRKSWWATKQLRPDVIFFLGDMMDGGRFAMSNTEYEAYYKRFRSIFGTVDVPVYYIPGNHDVGIGTSPGFSEKADDRYLSHFGPLNQKLDIANHTFVLIDAPSLVEEDRIRNSQGLTYSRWATAKPDGVIGFIERVSTASDVARQSTVLLTHIPLARPDTASCGPLREKGTIRAGAGYGYENTLSIGASKLLLQSIKPSAIFSGDDHDYCEYVHALPASDDVTLSEQRRVKEVSVKSFSMAMGVRRPGFQLLSLIPSSPTTNSTLHDVPCFLPDQLGIYLHVYVPLAVVSLVALFISNARRVRAASGEAWASHNSSRINIPDETSTTGRNLGALSLSVRRFGDDSDDEDGFILPPPTPAVSVTGKTERPRRMTITAGGWTIDVSTLRCCLVPYLIRSRWKRRGSFGGFLHDVLSVAWMPVGLLVAIAWWMFQ